MKNIAAIAGSCIISLTTLSCGSNNAESNKADSEESAKRGAKGPTPKQQWIAKSKGCFISLLHQRQHTPFLSQST